MSRFIVKAHGLYSLVKEDRVDDCEGDCDQQFHKTRESARKCLVRWFRFRAKAYAEAADQIEKAMKEVHSEPDPPVGRS